VQFQVEVPVPDVLFSLRLQQLQLPQGLFPWDALAGLVGEDDDVSYCSRGRAVGAGVCQLAVGAACGRDGLKREKGILSPWRLSVLLSARLFHGQSEEIR